MKALFSAGKCAAQLLETTWNENIRENVTPSFPPQMEEPTRRHRRRVRTRLFISSSFRLYCRVQKILWSSCTARRSMVKNSYICGWLVCRELETMEFIQSRWNSSLRSCLASRFTQSDPSEREKVVECLSKDRTSVRCSAICCQNDFMRGNDLSKNRPLGSPKWSKLLELPHWSSPKMMKRQLGPKINSSYATDLSSG